MRVSEVLKSGVDGQKVMVEGVFFMQRGVGYFCENIDDIEKKEISVLVDIKNLEPVLLSCVPAYAGGKFSYCDKAEISGTFIRQKNDCFNCSFINVDSFTIYKYGDAIKVEV